MPALEWSPLEDEGRSAPAVLYSKKVKRGFSSIIFNYFRYSNFINMSSVLFVLMFVFIRMEKVVRRTQSLTLVMSLTGQ